MDYKSGFHKGCLLLLAVVAFFSANAQTPMPGYYYSNFEPKTITGATVEFSPYSMPRQGILETFQPSMVDVSIGINLAKFPGNYKVKYTTEAYIFVNFANYSPREDSLIYPIYDNNQLTDYGKLAFSKLSMTRFGGQIIFWNNTPKNVQIGPGVGVSVGSYKYSFSSINSTATVSGNQSQTFVMFSPCIAIKYWFTKQIGAYLNLAYNFIADSEQKKLSLKSYNPNLGKTYTTFTPRIGVFYNFQSR